MCTHNWRHQFVRCLSDDNVNKPYNLSHRWNFLVKLIIVLFQGFALIYWSAKNPHCVIPVVTGTEDSKPPTMPLKLGRSFIISMIFSSAAVGGFGGGPPPVSLACFRAALKLFLALCCKLPHLNFTWSTVRRWIPTAFIISVTSAYFAFFRELVIKLLCFAFKTSLFFSKNSVKILISDSEQLLLLSRLVAIVTVRRYGKRACRRL